MFKVRHELQVRYFGTPRRVFRVCEAHPASAPGPPSQVFPLDLLGEWNQASPVEAPWFRLGDWRAAPSKSAVAVLLQVPSAGLVYVALDGPRQWPCGPRFGVLQRLADLASEPPQNP